MKNTNYSSPSIKKIKINRELKILNKQKESLIKQKC